MSSGIILHASNHYKSLLITRRQRESFHHRVKITATKTTPTHTETLLGVSLRGYWLAAVTQLGQLTPLPKTSSHKQHPPSAASNASGR